MKLRRLLAAAAFASVAPLAPIALAATDYTDSWWAAGGTENGWGVNLTQQRNFIFVTFFVYAVDGKPTWLTAQLSRDGTGERFTGPLYRTSGTWFGSPTWNGSQILQVGDATFVASSAYDGELTYTVDGSTIRKTIERLKLVDISIAGDYRGAVAGTRSGCGAAGGRFTDPIDFLVAHSPTTGEVRIDQYSTSTGRLICRMEGKAVQQGKLLLVADAAYDCGSDWSNKRARVYNLRPTPTGFEGQWFSDGGGGCTESGDFSGVVYR
jgi:hypothetical protein